MNLLFQIQFINDMVKDCNPFMNKFQYNQDNENENILCKENYDTYNRNKYAKILIEYNDDCFEYHFEFSPTNSLLNKINFENLKQIACNYWLISEANYNQFYITYNNKILSRNEILINHYAYLNENKYQEKYELKNRNFYIMDLNIKRENENKYQENKIEKYVSLTYFSEIELYECESKMRELANEYWTERGFLSERTQKIKNDNLALKITDLESLIVENEEDFKNFDDEEFKDFLEGYANKAAILNLKKKEKLYEVKIKAFNKSDFPLILTMKDLWVLKAKKALLMIFYIILLGFHLVYSRSEKNDNQLSFNLYNYLNYIFINNRVFKHFTGQDNDSKDLGYNNKLSKNSFKNRNDFFLFVDFFLSNILYNHSNNNLFRNYNKKKYNRLIINDPSRIAQRYINNTRDLIQSKFIMKYNFKFSNYFQFIKPIKSSNYKFCNSNYNNGTKNYYENYFNHFDIADLLTKNFSLCNGEPIDLFNEEYEQTENFKFNVKKSDFTSDNITESVNEFSYYVDKVMQISNNNSMINQEFASNITNNNMSDLFIAYTFNQEHSQIRGQLMEKYSNLGYVINLDQKNSSNNLYHDVTSIILKNLLFLDSLRVFHIKTILFFKKFNLFVKLDFFFELGALGIRKHNLEFNFIDYYSKVIIKIFNFYVHFY